MIKKEAKEIEAKKEQKKVVEAIKKSYQQKVKQIKKEKKTIVAQVKDQIQENLQL